jgi:hypothetical protein
MRISTIVLALALSITSAAAQVAGVAAGLAIPSAEIAQLPQSVLSDGWTALRSSAERGYFIEARASVGGDLALTGAVSFNRFLDATSEYSDGSGRTVSLISSQAIVPFSVGLEKTFGEGFVTPFATLEGTLSYFYRAYESPNDDIPVPFRIESSGETRYGVALGVGTSLDLAVLRFDAFVRAQIVNLFGDSHGDESTMYYMQAGVSGYFGL